MPLYEYVCSLGHTMERIGGLSDSTAPCSLCPEIAHRLEVNHVSIGTKEKKYRVSDFVEASSEIEHTFASAEQREGVPVKRPNLYKAGLKEANRRGAKVGIR